MIRTASVLVLGLLVGAPTGGAKTPDEIQRLPACPPIRGDARTGWSETKIRDSFSILLPPSCQEESGHRFVHGGLRWRCGRVTVEVVWGMWGASSFSESARKCAATIGGLRTMVVREQGGKGPDTTVWYPTGDVHEPLLSAWSQDSGDAAIVEGVAFSGKVHRSE